MENIKIGQSQQTDFSLKHERTPENLSSPEQLPQKLDYLSEAEIKLIGEKFGLTPDEVKKKVAYGLTMLASTSVSPEPNTPDFELQAEEKIAIDKPLAAKVNVGELGTEEFGIFVRNDKLSSFLGKAEREQDMYYMLWVSFDGNEKMETRWYDELFSDGEISKIALPNNDGYPHPERSFSYGIYDSEGKLAVILPFQSSVADREVSSANLPHFQKLFLRKVDNPNDEEFLLKFAQEVNAQVQLLCEQLHVSQKFMQNNELILCPQGSSFGFVYGDRERKPHYVLRFSKDRVEQLGNEQQYRNLLARHEFIHNLDAALGNSEKHFSEIMEGQILKLLEDFLRKNRARFITKVGANKSGQADDDSEINPYAELNEGELVLLNMEDFKWLPTKVRWRLESMIEERQVFQSNNAWRFGHIKDNIRELFASVLNVYLDYKFSETMTARGEGMMVEEFYEKLISLVRERVTDLEKTTHLYP